MPKQDRQAKRLKHVSGGNNLHRATKVKAQRVVRKLGQR